MQMNENIIKQAELNNSVLNSSGEDLYTQTNTESIESLEKKYELIYNNPRKKSLEASSVAIQLGLRYMDAGRYDKALEVMEKIKNRALY